MRAAVQQMATRVAETARSRRERERPRAVGARSLRIAPSAPHEKVYGRIGNLQVQLARSRNDIRRAQRLRYEVFYEEMSAVPSLTAQMRRRDEDDYDAICDHLLVVDTALAGNRASWKPGRRPAVVGTYRVLRQEIAARRLGFYTQREYDIAPLLAAHARHRFMELGRSCVLKPYRNKRSVELLWHGLWTYVREHKVDVMLGCASFEGTDANSHAMALSFLRARPCPNGAAARTTATTFRWTCCPRSASTPRRC